MIDYVTLGGEKRPIKLGMAALRKFTTAAGMKLADLVKIGDDLDLNQSMMLIYYALEDGARKEGKPFPYTLDDVCDWLDEEDKFEELFNAVMDQQRGPLGEVEAATTPP